ncbi:phthioceranic/hydroxyphthioceranic acid synthase [Aplochiton taeniatus]
MEAREEEIAIVGIGCNFPGGEGLENFWKVILEGRNCVVDIPEERFDRTYWYDPDHNKPGKTHTTKAALIDGFNEFDYQFFSVPEAEVDSMDPQHKLLLQCTYRALEDAGMTMEKISGTRTGVYIGLMNRDYETLLNDVPSTITHYSGTGAAMSLAANRISFLFNLTGPSFAIDSACSSSLVALHSACQAIKHGDCEMAVCGGVSCIIEPRVFVALSKAKMISPDGTSKPFSSKADGYGRGEGCGIVLLKPLKKALRDCDHIWGIISKTAVNQDGRTVTPITKPSMVQQEELLRGIYSECDLASVHYVEAHGTGTPVGDPIEAGSISKVIAKARPPGSETLLIGSVKGNIGHTESAAGVAGLIKVLLMMKHETIVPSVFYSEDSSSIDARTLNVRVPTKAEKWEKTGSQSRVAGINNFGFGGTNAHAIVKEYSQSPMPKIYTQNNRILFVVSAATEKSLALCITNTYQRLRGDNQSEILALAYTSACRRSHFRHKYRKAFVTFSASDLENQLMATFKHQIEPTRSDVRLAFVFCGNGVTYRGMGKLLEEEPVFRNKVKEIEDLFQKYKSTSVARNRVNYYDNEDHTNPAVVQPLLFAIQVGIATLLKHWGIKPDAILGHSVGEVAAAHCSGLLSLEDAVKVISYRSTLQSLVTGGKMLVVSNIAVPEVIDILPVYTGKVCLAAYNSPSSCTLSGHADAIDSLYEKLQTTYADKNIFLRALDVPAAYHSHMMDPILDNIEESIGTLNKNKLECELFSTVTGALYSHREFVTGRYWAKNIRETVLFEQTLRAVSNEKQSKGNMVFVEIGPRMALQRSIRETLGRDTVVLSSLQPEKGLQTILDTLAALFELGVQVDWDQFYKGCETLPEPFPVYQFDNLKKEVWFEAVRRKWEAPVSSQHPLLAQAQPGSKELTCILSVESAPYLWEHRSNGVCIAPGALYVELAYASILASSKPKIAVSSLQLSVAFQGLFTITADAQELKVMLERKGNETTFRVQSATATLSSGTMRCIHGQTLVDEETICLGAIYERCKLVTSGDEMYTKLWRAGFEYGSTFRHLGDVHFGEEFREAVTVIQIPDQVLKQLPEYILHPVVLDHFLQMTAVMAFRGLAPRYGFPSGIGSVAVAGPLQQEMVIYLRATEETSDYLDVCGCFSTKDGQVMVELKQVRIFFLDNCSKVAESLFFTNEAISITAHETQLSCLPKALVFEDTLGIAKALQPYIHPDSISIRNREHWACNQLQELMSQCLSNTKVSEVLFAWGIQDLTYLSTDKALECLVYCCEIFRRIVLFLKENQPFCTIRVITYRSAENIVDHVSPGSVLSGMTRACAAEIPDLSFQLVDLASVTSEDIKTLVHVIHMCKQSEVTISNGQVSSTKIVRTPTPVVAGCGGAVPSMYVQNFVLQTANPYQIENVSAMSCDIQENITQVKSVEIQIGKICVHSSDYFPVSVSHLNFGPTMYWNQHTSQNHKLLALDFSGTVTAAGKDVSHLKVGDEVVCCYPVAATSKVVVPEAACYTTKRLPFLMENPCMSYYVLAWEILQKTLPSLKQKRKMAIISANPVSCLVSVLVLAANRSGWNVISHPQFNSELQDIEHYDAFVFLAPLDMSPLVNVKGDNREKNIIVVCDNQTQSASSLPLNYFAQKSELTHIHKLCVSQVLQRANLITQKTKIFKWLRSLRLDAQTLSLKRDVFQSACAKDVLPIAESYFETGVVSQLEINQEGPESSLSEIPFLTRPRTLFKQNSVYIVTGGLSGLGFETVRFIAHNSGGCIVTLSRRSVSNEMQLELDTLQKRCGASIVNIQCDVSVRGQVEKAVTEIGQRFPSSPIKGVFHSAAVLHDALIETLEQSLFQKVLQPKVNGALNLHYSTLHNKLDYFVCYSSISSFIGNASQSNYAAANSFLDTFCNYRRNLGLAAQSINWGPLNLGLLLNQDHFQRFLEAKGMMIMDVCEVHMALEKCLSMNNPQQLICKFNFRNLNNHVLSRNAALRERLSSLVENELEKSILTAVRVPTLVTTCETVKEMLSEISNVCVEKIDDDTALCALGIDSMVAMTLQNQIFQSTGVNIPLVKLLDPNSTLSTLVELLREDSWNVLK